MDTNQQRPQDDDALTQRYREAVALHEASGDAPAPSPQVRARVLAYAQERMQESAQARIRASASERVPTGSDEASADAVVTANATKRIAGNAHPVWANGPISSQNQTKSAANDSFWSRALQQWGGMRAVASVAVMGLCALLYLQVERGDEAERELAFGKATTVPATPAAESAPVAPSPVPVPVPAPAAPSTRDERAAPTASKASPAPSIAARSPTPQPAPQSAPAPAPAARAQAHTESPTSARTADGSGTAQDKATAPLATPAPRDLAREAPMAAETTSPPPVAKPTPFPGSAARNEAVIAGSSSASIPPQPPPTPLPRAAAPAPAPPPAPSARMRADSAPSAAATATRSAAGSEPASSDPQFAAATASPTQRLFQAINANDLAALRAALQQGASPDARGPVMTIGQQTTAEGSTALITAIKQRREALVRALLQAGANPNLADTGLQTPLAHALATNQDSIAQALRAAGARE